MSQPERLDRARYRLRRLRNDTVNAGNGSNSPDRGAGNDTINGGAGNDLAIYALSRPLRAQPGGRPAKHLGRYRPLLGGGGINTLRLVVHPGGIQFRAITSQLAAYRQWLATNLASTQTFTLTFGASSGGLTVGGWAEPADRDCHSNRSPRLRATRLAVRSAACSR